jgi:transcriptional antiterminator RfaH
MAYWTVASTEAQREALAAHHLDRLGFEIYLPLLRARAGKIEPLFPGYVFVQVELQWRPINGTIGVLRVLTNGEQPARLANQVVDEIRSREDRSGFVRLPRLRRGNAVRVARGVFASKIGIYQGSTGKDRERVLLSLLGRQVRVEVPAKFLELT